MEAVTFRHRPCRSAQFDGCNAHAASTTDSVKEATELVRAAPPKSVAAVRAE